KVTAEIGHHGPYLRLSLRHRDAVFQPTGNPEPAKSPPVDFGRPGGGHSIDLTKRIQRVGHHYRDPYFRGQTGKGAFKVLGHDTNYGVSLAVELQRLAQHRGIAVEPRLPESVSDNRDQSSALGLLLLRSEESADFRLDTEHARVIRRREFADDQFGSALP